MTLQLDLDVVRVFREYQSEQSPKALFSVPVAWEFLRIRLGREATQDEMVAFTEYYLMGPHSDPPEGA